MHFYAYIPLAQAANLNLLEDYGVRVPMYVSGFNPDLLDTNGVGVPNIFELETLNLSSEQKNNIVALGGQWFESADLYAAWKKSLIEE